MPVINTTQIKKRISFQARYASRVINEHVEAIEGAGIIIRGLEVIRTGPAAIRVFPGRALLKGTVLEITAPQDLVIPPTLPRPFALYLRSNNDSPKGAVFLEFVEKRFVSIDGRGALLLRDFPADPISDDLMVATPPDPLLSEGAGVVGHRTFIAAAAQAVFPLDGFRFNPSSDEVLVFANGVKLASADFAFTGLETITLVAPLALDERLELYALRGNRFREEQIVGAGVLITLTGPNAYVPVLGDLLVFKDGVLLVPGPDYAETTPTTITLAVAAAGETYEIYGIRGLIHRETVPAVLGDPETDMVAHAYRPGSHDLLVFGDGLKRTTAFNYDEINGEQVRHVTVYQAPQVAIAAVPGPPDSTFADAGGTFLSSGLQIGRAVLYVTAVTGAFEINTVVQPLPFELPIASVTDETTLEIVDSFTDDPGDVTYEIRTPSFDGDLHTVLMHSYISERSACRDIGEYRDLGRGGGDALVDPEGNRPGLVVAGRINPIITLDDLNENAEVIAARGVFDQLEDRLNTLSSAAGVLVFHGAKHVQGGADPIAIATGLEAGLQSGVDKAAWDAHLGAGGVVNHLSALPTIGDPAAAGFLTGASQGKLDAINPLALYKGAWEMKFFSDFNQLIDPATFGSPEKGGNAFFILTRDGSINEIDSVSNLAASFTVRFQLNVTSADSVSVFFSLLSVFMSAPSVFIDGVKQPLGSLGSGRVEGSITVPAGPHRIDVVFYGIPIVGSIAGVRCGFNTDLLDKTDWVSTPGL